MAAQNGLLSIGPLMCPSTSGQQSTWLLRIMSAVAVAGIVIMVFITRVYSPDAMGCDALRSRLLHDDWQREIDISAMNCITN